MRFLASGKVKDIYDAGGQSLLFRFSDRVSAYDVRFGQDIPRKGEVLCKFAEFWFGRLGVPSHFVERRSDTEILVRRLRMIPVECVVRGYLYGSLYDRWRAGEARLPGGAGGVLASRLPEPVFDPTTKAEHDVPVGRGKAVSAGLVTGPEFDWLEEASLRVYGIAAGIAAEAGFVMADLKLEFGRGPDGIVLGDSIGPDECRLWDASRYEPGRAQEAYDKQVLRDWLSSAGHREAFEAARRAGREPVPPEIPAGVVAKMSARYAEAYERIAGRPL